MAERSWNLSVDDFYMGLSYVSDDYFYMSLAKDLSGNSKDPSTKVGAVVVTDGRVNGIGWNGFPKGVEETEERLNNRDTKYKFMVHAEIDALIMAGDSYGGTLYSTVYPCSTCAGAAIQAGIRRIVCGQPNPRFADHTEIVKQMCAEAKVELVIL